MLILGFHGHKSLLIFMTPRRHDNWSEGTEKDEFQITKVQGRPEEG